MTSLTLICSLKFPRLYAAIVEEMARKQDNVTFILNSIQVRNVNFPNQMYDFLMKQLSGYPHNAVCLSTA